jgi:PAS domain-containing protein
MIIHARSDGAEQLMMALGGSTKIGFAVLDNHWRYQMINERLAGTNGIPPIAHLGVPVSEIFGEISRQIAEPHYQRALSSGLATHFEVANQVLLTRPNQRYWGLNANFPIRNRDGKLKRLGIFVVEITEQRQLQRALRELSGRLSYKDAEKSCWYARKVHDCFDKYYEVLGVSFEIFFRNPANSMEQLVRSVEALDARLAAMSELVSEISASFPANISGGRSDRNQLPLSLTAF